MDAIEKDIRNTVNILYMITKVYEPVEARKETIAIHFIMSSKWQARFNAVMEPRLNSVGSLAAVDDAPSNVNQSGTLSTAPPSSKHLTSL